MRWAEPWWFLLLVLTPLPWLADWARGRVRWPSLGLFPPRRWRAGGAAWLRHGPLLLQASAIACLAAALARPQTVAGRTRIAARGVAIVLALDQSQTMTAEDFTAEGGAVSRLEAAKRTIDRFIRGRPDDLIGLVTFATYPDLACPPTLDHETLRARVAAIEPARAGEAATNIGDAIAWSLEAALRAGPSRRVVVVLTDGQNQPDRAATPEAIDPDLAAALAPALGARLHAIGIGRPGGTIRIEVPDTGISYPETLRDGYDAEALARWAELGGGDVFSALDSTSLDAVFDRIDALETSPVRGIIRTRYHEEFPPWVASALILLALDRLASASRLARIP